MRYRILFCTVAVAAAMIFTSCKPKAQDEAEALLERANTEYAENQYDKALATIDSLRKIYPSAIDVRKKALRLYQVISLKQTQEQLALTDSALQAVTLNYNYLKTKVEKDKAELRATPEELELLTLTRMKRDSLQTQYDVQCKKIKYIHKKQKEI